MFRITAIIVLSLSDLYLNDAQQVPQNWNEPLSSTDELLQSLKMKNMLDLNSAVICEQPRRCVNYAQCEKDSTYNTKGIGIIMLRFLDGRSHTILHGNEVYATKVNNSIITRSGEEKAVCQFFERCCGEAAITQPINIVAASADNKNECGFSNQDGIGFSVTNPGKAQFGEYPWMVAVMWKYPDVNSPELAGGGSLINSNVILTAAHILRGKTSREFMVRAGEWDAQSESEPLRHQQRNVKQIIIHEYANISAAEYDFALLVVDQSFVLDLHIQPICLPTSNLDFEYINCYSTGWGNTEFLQPEYRQCVMKKIDLPVIPFAQCQDALRKTHLGEHFQLHHSFICAGGMIGKDTCTGDGGSPLMCPVDGQPKRYYQAGIVAWGLGCGSDGIPGVYANVALVREWIDRQMLGLGYGSGSYSTS